MEYLWHLFVIGGLISGFCVLLASVDAIMDRLCRVFPRLNAWIDSLAKTKADN